MPDGALVDLLPEVGISLELSGLAGLAAVALPVAAAATLGLAAWELTQLPAGEEYGPVPTGLEVTSAQVTPMAGYITIPEPIYAPETLPLEWPGAPTIEAPTYTPPVVAPELPGETGLTIPEVISPAITQTEVITIQTPAPTPEPEGEPEPKALPWWAIGLSAATLSALGYGIYELTQGIPETAPGVVPAPATAPAPVAVTTPAQVTTITPTAPTGVTQVTPTTPQLATAGVGDLSNILNLLQGSGGGQAGGGVIVNVPIEINIDSKWRDESWQLI